MDGKRIERLQILLTLQEMNILDDWRFVNRIPTRSAAARELIRRGMATEDAVKGNESSRDYGVIDPG
jgi:hypothetical protein